MFRFRVRKIPGPLLKFTQKAVLFQDISIFFVLKTELYLSSGTYFFFWKLVFHFTNFLMTEVNSLIQAIFKLDYKFSGYIECRPPCGKTAKHRQS